MKCDDMLGTLPVLLFDVTRNKLLMLIMMRKDDVLFNYPSSAQLAGYALQIEGV